MVLTIADPHIITVEELIAFGQFGRDRPKISVDSATGTKSASTTTTGVSSEVRDRMNLVINGVEADFERRSRMSFGRYVHDEVVEMIDMERSWAQGIPFPLKYTNVQPIDADQGDEVQMRRMHGDWEDVPSDAYWFDTKKGILRLEKFNYNYYRFRMRVKYRYGIVEIGEYDDVKFAVMKKSLLDMMSLDISSTIFQTNNMIMPLQTTMEKWREDYEEAVANRRNIIFVRMGS